jgi:DNA-binding PadR family transcriptional regulator
MPRGLLKYAILYLLNEHETHGYELLQMIRERRWGTPGPGSVYPLLGTLESDGLIRSREEQSRRIYTVTPQGKNALAIHGKALLHLANETTKNPDGESQPEPESQLRHSATRLMQALSHIEVGLSDETIARACDILDRARKEIYTMLADD